MAEQPPPLRYLSAADVQAAMPPVEERLTLALRTMTALVANAELPPKIGVHPRQAESHSAAMPALLRGAAASGEDDLFGVKWVTAFAGNRSIGLPAIHATVLLNDPTTGLPLAVVDGGPITAERTAAVSGVVLREWWPDVPEPTVALLGAGVQGASHVEVLAQLVPGCPLTIVDRTLERAEALANVARGLGQASVTATSDLESAVAAADVVLTMVSFGPNRQAVAPQAFARARLIVAVDYDMCVPASVVSGSSRFLVDDVAQFEAIRTDVIFRGYPQPDGSIGQALVAEASLPAAREAGPLIVNHLGVGLADVVFADAIVRRAAEMGLGTELTR
jgi:ornithine cyclodeaminase/alanine dehydrogenase-like protein (mu-crystallin family)